MSRLAIYDQFRADKYSADDLKDMLDKGHAMENPSGDPSYPIADEDDLDKAIKAVGRGSADHDDIRKHIIARAKALGLESKIPDNWADDGSLTDADEAKSAPATEAERRDAALSFGDIQSRVYEALLGTLEAGSEYGPDLWIEDLGPDWVVFQRYDVPDPGLYQLGWMFDAVGVVQFAGDPVRVDRQTTFVPVQLNGDEQMCCDGRTASGHRHDSTDGRCCTDTPASEDTGQRSKLSGRRRRPLTHQRRSLERLPEFRRVTTAFERRVEQNGDEIVLRGMPIVYDTPYSVRDMFGTFRETMKDGVASKVIASRDLDCRFLANHDGLPYARTVSGTLVLSDVAGRGLLAEPHLDARSQSAYDLAIGVERGDITQMSVGFCVADEGDEWRWGDDGTEERDIHEIGELFDVSAVTYPASPTTSIELAERMMARAGAESRERIRRLFDLGAAVRSGQPLAQKDGEALRSAAEALYRVDAAGVPMSIRLDAYTKATEAMFGALRAGKALSADNQADIEAALEALHSCDDIDIPSITRSLEQIDKALDAGQAGLATVLGRATPDGDKGDLEPTLVAPTDAAADKDARALQKARLELVRTRHLLVS